MAGIERFEDIEAWQGARALVTAAYRVTGQGAFATDFGLRDQLRRAAVSIMSNIAEGFDRGGRAEFHQFLSTAKASCAETRSLLYVALDAGYLDRPTFKQLMACAEEVARVTGGLRSAVEKQRHEQRAQGGQP